MRVLAFGTFDGVHPGHERYLAQARAYGDELVVVVARDETVREVKGRGPKRPEAERLAAIAALPGVDRAVLGYPDDKYRIIEEILPEVIVLGYDQEAFTENLAGELERRGLAIVVVRADPFEPERYKSSKL